MSIERRVVVDEGVNSGVVVTLLAIVGNTTVILSVRREELNFFTIKCRTFLRSFISETA